MTVFIKDQQDVPSVLSHGIDHIAALDRFNGNRRLYIYSLRQFFDKHLNFVRDFIDSYSAANYRLSKVFIHNLSSQSAMLGVYKVHYYADLVERQLVFIEKDSPSLMQNLVIIEGCILEAKLTLEPLILELASDDQNKKAEEPSPQKLVAQLSNALHESDPNALRVFREHQEEYRIIFSECFERLSESIQQFEFANALKLIQAFQIAAD